MTCLATPASSIRARRFTSPARHRHTEVFLTAEDATVYLDLMRYQLADAEVSMLAFCLVTNHVHWLVVPNRPDLFVIASAACMAAMPKTSTWAAVSMATPVTGAFTPPSFLLTRHSRNQRGR